MAMGTATSGSDIIFATRNGELIDGLAGNDLLASNYRDTTLIGNAGNDLLLGIDRIRETGSSTEVRTSSELHGDDGNDVLTSALEFDLSAGAKVIGNLSIDGGTGNDTIASAVDVDASDGGFLFLDSWRVAAGSGRDLVSLAAAFGGSDANINVFAEDGDDWITTVIDGRGVQQDLDGGAGSDHIFSRLTTEGFLGNAYGDSGDDVIGVKVVLRTAESFAGLRLEEMTVTTTCSPRWIGRRQVAEPAFSGCSEDPAMTVSRPPSSVARPDHPAWSERKATTR